MINNFEYTGVLRDVRRCYINDTKISFLFGYVVEHKSPRFSEGDWFASSYIKYVKAKNGKYLVYTANSIYLIDSYASLIVADESVDNIRTGTPPELLNARDNADDLTALVSLNKVVRERARQSGRAVHEVVGDVLRANKKP